MRNYLSWKITAKPSHHPLPRNPEPMLSPPSQPSPSLSLSQRSYPWKLHQIQHPFLAAIFEKGINLKGSLKCLPDDRLLGFLALHLFFHCLPPNTCNLAPTIFCQSVRLCSIWKTSVYRSLDPFWLASYLPNWRWFGGLWKYRNEIRKVSDWGKVMIWGPNSKQPCHQFTTHKEKILDNKGNTHSRACAQTHTKRDRDRDRGGKQTEEKTEIYICRERERERESVCVCVCVCACVCVRERDWQTDRQTETNRKRERQSD